MREKRIRVWRKMSRKEMQKKEKENMGSGGVGHWEIDGPR
jgi:hypothetical protein